MPRRRQGRRREQAPKTLNQVGVDVEKHQPHLGSTIIAIDTQLRYLNIRIDKAIALSQPRGSGSVVGSEVQVSFDYPMHQTAFDWLETVRQTLTQLVDDAP